MRDVLLIHDNNLAQAFITTSLIKRLNQEHCRIHCLTDEQSAKIFQFCPCKVENISTGTRVKYDVAINATTSILSTDLLNRVEAKIKLGYGREEDKIMFFNEGADLHFRANSIGVPTNANLFQLVFGIANLTWHGEGYNLQYFPRNRAKKIVGTAIRNEYVNKYISTNLKKRLCEIPFKQNVLKQIDETNRCKSVITDDDVIFHISVALRKEIEFLIKKEPAYKIEFFGKGHTHVLKGG